MSLSTDTAPAARNLGDFVDALEEEASTAVVPGELVQWCRILRQLLGERDEESEHMLDQQARTLERTADEDPELLARTENMMARLERCRHELDELGTRLEEVCQAAEPGPRTSAEPTKAAQRLRRDVLSWIVDARALDREILTWYQESLTRDRGVVD